MATADAAVKVLKRRERTTEIALSTAKISSPIPVMDLQASTPAYFPHIGYC
jgi:hypothetical protein